MSFFELGMLVCFGLAWPVSIYKSLTSRTAKGKSVVFILVILTGYAFGILHKLCYSLDIVLAAYIFNFLLVATDLILYFRNKKLDQARDSLSTSIHLPASGKSTIDRQ